MRVQKNPEDIGRCGCGRRKICDGSHGLTEDEWQMVIAKENTVTSRIAVNDDSVAADSVMNPLQTLQLET